MNALEKLLKEKKYLMKGYLPSGNCFSEEDVRKALLDFATKDILEFTELGEDDYTEGRNAVVLEIASEIKRLVGK